MDPNNIDDTKKLEEEFNNVISELRQDSGLTKFRREYELLYTALRAS